MPTNVYVPLILITDANAGGVGKLTQHVVDLVADFNARADVLPYTMPPAPPAAPHAPRSKGIMTWHTPTPAREAAELAHSAGLSWMAVKVHDGTIRAADGAAIIALKKELDHFGIEMWGWGYCYLHDPAGEAALAVSQVQSLGLAGYMIDVEGEAAAAGAAACAALAAGLRPLGEGAHIGAPLPIGLCSYRYPSLHKDLGWAELLTVCTFHAPQVYWLDDFSPTASAVQLRRSVTELTALKAIPVIPIGCAFGWGQKGFVPTVAQILNFYGAAVELHLQGHGWFSWESAAALPAVWSAIASLPAG